VRSVYVIRVCPDELRPLKNAQFCSSSRKESRRGRYFNAGNSFTFVCGFASDIQRCCIPAILNPAIT
jgi:hypothetical protein